MRIKKLELQGFKSFKDRTVIQFDAGITGIVGPNGCGKSNIVDALVWVMGEMSAKHLRGSSMEDVIFAGSENYAPVGMAEVSLTLENDGGAFPVKFIKHSEIMITRRLHRNGESEYLINKEPVRLRDVQEVFMDTGAGSKGFSIIEQGAIGKIITAKPEDRRVLIEEAAGITKFKARKKESQRKMQATDQNLLRLQDIVGELRRQIDSLERQAQKAERYRGLKRQIEELDLALSSSHYLDHKNTIDLANQTLQEAQDQDVAGEAEFKLLMAEVERLKLDLLTKEKEVETAQTAFYDQQSQVSRKEMEVQELRFEIEQARRNEQMTGSLLQEQKARSELLLRDQKEAEERLVVISQESQELETLYHEKNSHFEGVHSRIQEIDDELTTKRRELFAVGQTDSQMDAKFHSMTSQVEQAQEKIEHEQSLMIELVQKRSEFEARKDRVFAESQLEAEELTRLTSAVENLDTEKKTVTENQKQKKIEVDEFKDELNQVVAQLYGLENLQNSFEGFEAGVKNVMLWQRQRAQTNEQVVGFSPVSEVVEVPAEYEIAMEAALGQRLQLLLSEDSQACLEAVDHLKDQNSGRSSFLSEGVVLEKPAHASPASEEGVKALLKDVVSSSEKYKKTVSTLLDEVAVVESLRTALALRPRYPQWTFVTLDGDTLSSDGVLTGGGSEGADSGLLQRRREIKELSLKRDEFSGKLALSQAQLTKLTSRLEAVTAEFEAAQKQKTEQEIKVNGLKKDYERAEQELQNAQTAVTRQEREVARLNENMMSLQNKLSEIETQLQEIREKKSALEEESEDLLQELNTSRLGFEGLQNEVRDLQVKNAIKSQEVSGLKRQLEMLTKSVTDLEQQLERMSEENSKSSESLTENQLKMEEQKIELEKFISEIEDRRLKLAQLKNEYEVLAQQVRSQDEKLGHLSLEKNTVKNRINEFQLKYEQSRMKAQYLIDQVREKYMLELPEVFERHLNPERDLGSAETELKDLRDRLGRMGDVNLAAIEEFEETKNRYEFLTKQQTDLIEAKEQLRKVIDRINRICTRRFKETFDLVNERFTKVFPVLFGGGEARLEIHEDVEKAELGIEIIARPPGKKMQNVTLMSGGEKALTAVALIFSIFLVKPSPYCLLDEVDAPLDDANVYRYNDLVREMAKRSQIIVVTHNKHTMDVVGKLYGVTMQEKGVSKMVSVSLQDVS